MGVVKCPRAANQNASLLSAAAGQQNYYKMAEFFWNKTFFLGFQIFMKADVVGNQANPS